MSPKLRTFLIGLSGEAATIASIQAVNYLAPLAALPFLSRGLGMTAFGIYATALVLSTYVAILSDYTFNINGPLRLHRENALPPGDRTLLATSALIRLSLAAVCSPLAAGVLLLATGADLWSAASTCACMIATAATPRWAMYAQGQLRPFLLATAVSRGIWFIGAIWVCTLPSGLPLLLTWTALCQLFLATACWLIVRPATRPAMTHIAEASRRLLREDFGLFLSSTAIALVREGAPFALSILHGPAAMSLYAVADRLKVAAIGLSTPFSQSLFLRRARSSTNRTDDEVRGIGNIIVLGLVVVCCLILATFAEQIVLLLAGQEYVATTGVLQVLLLAPPAVCLNAIIGTNTLLAEGEHESYSRAQLFAAIMSTPPIIALVYAFGIWGAAIAAVMQELVLTAVFIFYLSRKGLLARALTVRRVNEHDGQ